MLKRSENPFTAAAAPCEEVKPQMLGKSEGRNRGRGGARVVGEA